MKLEVLQFFMVQTLYENNKLRLKVKVNIADELILSSFLQNSMLTLGYVKFTIIPRILQGSLRNILQDFVWFCDILQTAEQIFS